MKIVRGPRRRSRWWQKHAMDRIVRCLPPDARQEAKEVLTALDPDNPTAALCWLFKAMKVEVLARRQELKGAAANKEA